MFFVFQTQKNGAHINLENVIELNEVPDDAEFKHIHIEFNDTMNIEYKGFIKQFLKSV